jgi:hypothetical protein
MRELLSYYDVMDNANSEKAYIQVVMRSSGRRGLIQNVQASIVNLGHLPLVLAALWDIPLKAWSASIDRMDQKDSAMGIAGLYR